MGLFNKKKSLEDSGLLGGATDRHSHILFGVDDGISSLEESLQAIAMYEQQGLSDLWLTPHVMEDIPNTTEGLKSRFRELSEAYIPEGESSEGRLRLHLAAEYMADTLLESRIRERDLLTMEDNMVLVETSTWSAPVNLYGIFDSLAAAGYRPVFAHVERYRYLNERDYDTIHDMGVLMQLNFASIIGGYGENSCKRALKLLEKGYYSFWGSDCHRFSILQKQLSSRELDKKLLESVSPLFH